MVIQRVLAMGQTIPQAGGHASICISLGSMGGPQISPKPIIRLFLLLINVQRDLHCEHPFNMATDHPHSGKILSVYTRDRDRGHEH